MSTPVMNNGIFMRDTNYQVSSHLDSYHLRHMLGDMKPDDMGLIDIFAARHKNEAALYQFSNFGGKNTITIDNPNGEWKWKIPKTNELPYIIEDIEPGNTSKGMDGLPFKIKLSEREFGHGDVITYDKYNGAELYITDDDILPVGDGFIYTVRLVNNDNYRFLDNQYLSAGTEFFRKSSFRGEYGERFSDIQVKKGFREFFNFVGGTESHVHYSISSKADLILRGGMLKDGSIPVTELWKNFDNNLDPSVASIEDMQNKMGADYVRNAIATGTLQKTFLTKLEAAHIHKLIRDVETYLMWGHGGRVTQDGPDDIRASVGMWKQLDSSYVRIYNKSSFSLDLFRSELFNYYNGKVDFEGPDPKRTIVVQTGMGGMKLVSEAVRIWAAGSGLTINATDIGAITNKGMNLGFGYAYTSFVIPFLANVQFVLNPAFDNLQVNQIENPTIDGYNLSSYSFVVFDVTEDGNDNIFLLEKKGERHMKWWYQNGTMDYMGNSQGFMSSGQFNGYRVYMTKTHPAIWVKDPSRVLKIVMRNPKTGGYL